MRKTIKYKAIAALAVIALLLPLLALTRSSGLTDPPPAVAAAPAAAGTGETQNLSYIYFGSPSEYAQLVDRTQDALDTVSPSYFDLNADGSLKLTPAVQQGFVDEMHARGIKVTPFLSNHWDRVLGQKALENRAALVSELAQAVYDYGLDGVNVDLENLTPGDRADYTDFVSLLRAALPDKVLTVAVASNPWETTDGWAGSYDYTGLAAQCDSLLIMTYDEHCRSGPPGAVAGISFVERSLQYALKHVPKEKLLLGIAFYGRIWNNEGGNPQGAGISNTTVEDLIRRYSGTVTFDIESQSPYAVIEVKASDETVVIGGAPLDPGTYTIWFENEASLKRKLKLVNEYGILGTGSWSLGQETADTWNYYRLWLRGCYFEDIQTHWAKKSVLLSWQNGWVNGLSAASFSPDGVLTRAQAAVMLSRALALSVSGVSGSSFDDTDGHWAQAEIEAAREAGLISGVGNNRFEPDMPMTREQMAVLLYNMERVHSAAAGNGAVVSFSDVTPEENPWSFEAIRAMSGSGVLLGFPDGSFRPIEPLLRAQRAALIVRLSEQYFVF